MARIGGLQEGYPSWAGPGQLIGDVVIAAGERARRELWVPQMQMHAEAEWAGSKRHKASSSHYSYW